MTGCLAIRRRLRIRAKTGGCLLALFGMMLAGRPALAAVHSDQDTQVNPDGSYSITRLHLPGLPPGSLQRREFTPKGIEWMVMTVSDLTAWPSPASVTLEGSNGAVLGAEQLWAGSAKHPPVVRQVDFIDMNSAAQDATIWFDDDKTPNSIAVSGPKMTLSIHRSLADGLWHDERSAGGRTAVDPKGLLPPGVPTSFKEAEAKWNALVAQARIER